MECEWGELIIAPDQMSASIALIEPPPGEKYMISTDLLRAMVRSAGIKLSPREDALVYLSKDARYGEVIEVVHGKEPVRGKDGYYTFSVPTEDMRAKPIINGDGTADYKNSLALAIVTEGETFATYTPATPGEYGYDIFSKMVAPMRGKDLPPLHGHGVRYDDKTREYHAEYAGHITKTENTITIEKLYRVSGDLDLQIGNINFNGDVEIAGDVRSGLSIKADGNVFVHGHVGACNIRAGKNVTIEKGVQGKDNCIIYAKGDVACKFVERCRILADGNIYADSVLYATLVARNQICVNSKSGQVLSSSIRGMLGVTVKEAGNESETATILQSGVPKDEVDYATKLSRKVYELDKKAAKFDAHRKRLDTLPEDTPKLAEIKNKIMRAKVVLGSDRKKITDELNPILELIEKSRRESFVRILGVAHVGIKIHIGGIHYLMEQSFRDVRFRVRGNKIIMESGDDANTGTKG